MKIIRNLVFGLSLVALPAQSPADELEGTLKKIVETSEIVVSCPPSAPMAQI